MFFPLFGQRERCISLTSKISLSFVVLLGEFILKDHPFFFIRFFFHLKAEGIDSLRCYSLGCLIKGLNYALTACVVRVLVSQDLTV